MPNDLSDSLRRLAAGLHEAGPGKGTVSAARQALLDRLNQDLLPRTAGGPGYLAVGIVGPNNAGKSALFNALSGVRLSPSLPTGGATRRLLAALGPELLIDLQGDPQGLGLQLIPAEPGRDGVAAALDPAASPEQLLCVALGHMPRGLLLVDTPDFDSVAAENRAASEALLRTVDLALVVVTRHTYQNAEVVRFLREWLAHGKPWALVYNEAVEAETTLEHAAKLGRDVGEPPNQVFLAPFDPEVAKGTADLAPVTIQGLGLKDWLWECEDREVLKQRAMAASLGQLRGDWETYQAALRAAQVQLASQVSQLQDLAGSTGRSIAEEAMPMGPFLEAFRAVLDRRPGLLPTGYRAWLGKARGAVTRGLQQLPWARRSGATSGERAGLALLEAERSALAKQWPPFYESLAKIQEAGVAMGQTGERVNEAAAGRLHAAGQLAAERLGDDPAVLEEFQAACEQRMEAELDERGDPWMLQAAVDAMHLFPAAVAGLVIVKTGGLGADVAVGGVGALSTLLSERLSRLLGSGVAAAARERWRELRGAALAPILLECALPDTWPALQAENQAATRALAELEPLVEFLGPQS